MKARLKKTGEILDVVSWGLDGSYVSYMKNGELVSDYTVSCYKDFESIVEDNIDWEQRKFEIIKSAVTGLYSKHDEDYISKFKIGIIKDLNLFADELIKQFKNNK